MRIGKYLLIIFLLLIHATTYANDLGLIRLSLIEGDVQIVVQDTTDWTEATINLPLNEGDRLWVSDNGKAELQIRGGVYARADGNSALDILTVTNDSAQFYLGQGHVYINNRRGGIKTVQVDTPLSSLRSYDNSIMMIDISEDGVTEISVLKGYVYAESRAGATQVSAGKTLTIRGENNAELAPIGSPDDWERWNMERDQRLNAWGESSRYLPDELHEYASDFDDNGRWDYVSDYGYVWVPAVMAASWAPYTYGRWVWIRGSYVWIDYNPWGWAPGHYGRWVFTPARGWCWVPPSRGAVYWGPGYVGWIVTPSYVAWVPLAPGEIYYGYGYYGPGSINIAAVNINTVMVNRTYVNARVNNSVVVVQRDSFGTGRRVPVKVKENPFLERKQQPVRNISVVPPRVRPEHPIVLVPPEAREHAGQRPPEREQMPREVPATPRAVPAVPPAMRTERPAVPPPAAAPSAVAPHVVPSKPEQQLPPERVRTTRPEEMKNERRLVKERDASVFKPQTPENLPVKRSNEPRVINRKPVPQQGEQPRQ
ncbi:MAG TPA: DUF6600 domain-containing protein, partial [Nitrospirota bacterium]